MPAISEDMYEFTVEVNGRPYDVYWFTKDDKVGQLAFAKNDDDTWVIALFRPGRKGADEVAEEIRLSEERENETQH